MAYFPVTAGNDTRIGHWEQPLPAIAAGGSYTLTHSLGTQSVRLTFRKNIGGDLISPGDQGQQQFIDWRLDYGNMANAVVIRPDVAIGDSEIHVMVEGWYGTNDVIAPTAPTIVEAGVGVNDITVTASGATDSWGVKGYNWLLDGVYVWTTYAPTYTFVGLNPATEYDITCHAIDAAGNASPVSNTVTETTFGDPVTLDLVGTADGGTVGFNPSVTIGGTHTASGTDRAVIIAVSGTHNSQDASTRTHVATYGGVAMTLLGLIQPIVGGSRYVLIFGLIDPPTGAQAWSATLGSGGNTGRAAIGVPISYSGVNGFGAVTTATGSGTAMSVASSPATIAERVVAAFHSAGAVSAFAPTQRYSGVVDSNKYILAGDGANAGAFNLTGTTATSDWSGIAVELLP